MFRRMLGLIQIKKIHALSTGLDREEDTTFQIGDNAVFPLLLIQLYHFIKLKSKREVFWVDLQWDVKDLKKQIIEKSFS